MSLVLIYWGSKSELSLYTLVNAGLMLGLGIQNAVINTPLVVNGARLQGDEREILKGQLARLQGAMCLAVGMVGAAIAALAAPAGTEQIEIGIAVLIGVGGGWLREFRRGELLLERRYGALLVGDLIYTCLALGIVCGYAQLSIQIQAWPLVLAVGLAGVVTGLHSARGWLSRGAKVSVPWNELRSQMRWTSLGMALSWVQSAAYPFVVALTAGHAAVAEVAAARLFISPGLLVNGAYGRYLLPRLDSAQSNRARSSLTYQVRSQVSLSLASWITYAAGVSVFLLAGGLQVLPAAYSGLEAAVAAWLFVLCMTCMRLAPGVAMQARAEFRRLALMGGLGALVTLGATSLFGASWGGIGCIVGVGIGEALLFMMMWRQLRRPHVDGQVGVASRVAA